MASYTIEDIELIRKKSGISYQEAVALLDYHNGNVARALIDLERNGRIQSDEPQQRPQRFVDHYLLANGKPVSSKAGYQNMSYAEQFKDRDPRLAQTIQGPDYIAAGESEHEVLSWERTLSGYRIIKFISDSSHEGATTSTTDYPVFRYAEVLLNYAEAKAELGELTKADVNATIDLLRARVGMTKMGDVPADIDPMMEEYYPNALIDTYKGVSGYIYFAEMVEDSGFQTQIPDAVTSEKPIVVNGCEYIEDAYEAIIAAEKQGLVRILRYNELSPKMKNWLKETTITEYEQASEHPEYRFFLEAKFGDLLKQ